MPPATVQIPEVGQAVRVRNRLATVRAVEPYDSRDAQGRLHIVDVEYLDDCRYPEAEQLLWEVEATATVLGKPSRPGVDAHRPDSPQALQAFVNAHRWTRLNRLRETDGIEDEPLLGVWNSAIQVHPYQLEPVLRALSMPRVSLLLADGVGLGKTIQSGLVLEELIATAKELLGGCVQGCETACYACLKTFRNQFHHNLLNRHQALALMADMDHTPQMHRNITPVFEEERAGEGTPSNPPEARLVALLREHHFPEGECRKSITTTAGMPTSPDWLYEPTKVAVYLDGMSRGLHGDPKTAQRDQLIRGMLELDGYTVVVVQSRDLNDPQAVRQHLRNLAQAIGRMDLAEAVDSRPAESSGSTTFHDRDDTGRTPPDPATAERRREADEALRYCDERCRRLVQACVDRDLPLPLVGFELPGDDGRVCAEAELAWEGPKLAVLLPERSDNREEFRRQGWTVFLV